jgi:hypothetical protein
MTNSLHGSSLIQTRNSHHPFRLHNRSPSHDNPNRHHHRRSHEQPHQQQPRQETNILDALVTHVIQTVSLVQVVDSAGVPIEVQTIYSPPSTVVVDPETGITVGIISAIDSLVPTPTVLPDPGLDNDLNLPIPTPTPTVLPEDLDPLPSQEIPLTSAPLTTPSAFPTLSGPFNSSNRKFLFQGFLFFGQLRS